MITASIVKDSCYTYGIDQRITTFELEYPRFIHSELMTHRVFSRNAASSRAIPINKMLEMIKDYPAMPSVWGTNNSGMQSKGIHEDPGLCKEVWKEAAKSAVEQAEKLRDLGLHKQIVNRVLEPFQIMKTVVTATEWENFFELRTHKDAQPEFQRLANIMKLAMICSEPQPLHHGEHHIPYVDSVVVNDKLEHLVSGIGVSLDMALKVSASCCAQVSYRLLDNSIEKAIGIYDKLVNSKPIHASPFEHQAECVGRCTQSGNFRGWKQHRKELGI